MEDMLDFSAYFKKTNFSYIRRNFNGAAHCLAKFNFEQGNFFEWDEPILA